jgi:replicative DNA helicase
MAEAQLLGGLLAENANIDRVADLVAPDDFYSPVHRRIFEAIVTEFACGKMVSPVTLKLMFADDPDLIALGGAAYLARMTMDNVGIAFPAQLAEHVRDVADRRRMRAGLLEAIEVVSDVGRPIPEAAALADTAIAARAESNIVESDAAEAMKHALAALDKGIEGVTCPRIKGIDDLLGPLEPSSLTIVAGRPGMGKTAWASSYTLGAATAGQGVLFVSLEMSRDQLAHRMLADESFDDADHRIPYSAIQERRLNYHDRKQANEVAARIALLPFHIVDAASMTVDRLDMMVRRYKRRFAARGRTLNLVVVDYLQLLSVAGKNVSPYDRISEVSRRLKQIAKEHDVAMLALAQLSRSVEQRTDKRPILSDLRDSGQIEQDADAVLFLYREEYYLRQAEPRDDVDAHEKWEAKMERARGNIDFLLPKRRNGSAGTGYGRFYAPYQAVR